jgi:hypothetical protein
MAVYFPSIGEIAEEINASDGNYGNSRYQGYAKTYRQLGIKSNCKFESSFCNCSNTS